MSRTKNIFLEVLFFLIVVFQTASQAGTLDLIGSGATQDAFKKFSKELGLAVSYLPLAPAEPLGIIGFDAGAEVTTGSIKKISGAKTTLVLPKLHLQKGLPFGFDVGAVYSQVSALDIALVGAELKYALISGNVALPAVALRAGYTKLTGVDELDLSTLSADLSVSKGFTFITPYAGVGMVQVTAKEKAGLNLAEEKQSLSKQFVGVKISLAVINFVLEADFSDVPLYTLRINAGL
jgi:hypothetical protein